MTLNLSLESACVASNLRGRDSAPPIPQKHAIAQARRVVSWYFECYFGTLEGPGCPPFYADPSRVGAFAVDPVKLAANHPEEVFRLAVGLTMYQARRDLDIMAAQARMSPALVAQIASASEVCSGLGDLACGVERTLQAFHVGCDVAHTPTGPDCTQRPRATCPVKTATKAFQRYGDFGKVPFSLALVAPDSGTPTLSGLYEEALRRHAAPMDRARWLEETLCQAWRIEKKIANFILSALANPDLTPGVHPWREGIDWRWFVVIDRHVMRALVELGAPERASYEVYRTWLLSLSAKIDLRRHHPGVHADNPRLVQQALYRFRSVSNRRAEPGDCCQEGPGACLACPSRLRFVCPVALV